MTATSTTADVVVIGSGVVGASVAFHLVMRGCTDVLVLDRAGDIGSSSTARSGAGVRHQWSSPTNILLSQYSIAHLHAFCNEVGVDPGLRLVGYLFLIREPTSWASYQQSVALQHAYGVPTQCLTPAQAATIVPSTRIDDLQGATFCDQDGYCDPLAIRNGYLGRAVDLGVRVHHESPVIGLSAASTGAMIVRTPQGAIHCATVVNAAGGWAGAVGALANLTVPVQHFRRHLFVLHSPAPLSYELPFTFDVDSGFYMRSAGAQIWCGMINPLEQAGHNLVVDWAWMPEVLAAGRRRFPFLQDWEVDRERSWAGTYEMTPDHAPILGRHPELPNYVDANGFSGHGIMHAPATGMLIAEEILDGHAHSIDIDELRIMRFQTLAGAAEHQVF